MPDFLSSIKRDNEGAKLTMRYRNKKWLICIFVFLLLLMGCRTKPTSPVPTSAPTMLVTTTPSQRTNTMYYTIQESDSMLSIAQKFQLEPQTLVAANTEAGILVPGAIIRIPPKDGVYYRWRSSETLEQVAQRFEVDHQVILDWHENAEKVDSNGNYLEGARLFIPGGKIEAVDFTLPVQPTQ